MKKNISLLFLTAIVLSTYAERRPSEQIRALAAQAIAQTASARLESRVSHEPIQVLHDMSQLSVLGYAEGGWAIITKDDAFDAVVAYSDSKVDMTNPSPEFIWLLTSFNNGMETDLAHPAQARRLPAKTTSLGVIEPLLKTHWHQSWPYNEKCPLVNGTRCVCGCVATAFAQVMYYHQLPQHPYGKESYTWNKTETISYNFDAAPFDWSSITATYAKGVSTQAQIDAVSSLILACGVWANMAYSPTNSGSVLRICATNFNKNNDEIRTVDHTNYSANANARIDMEVVANELNAGRPLIFGGEDEKGGGHCFIIDGADSKGQLHCNLGWGGQEDGYYSPSFMAGYTLWQQLVTLIPGDYANLYNPVDDFSKKRISVDEEQPISELKPNTWYMMWNVGRSTGLCDLGKENQVACSSKIPHNSYAPYAAGQLVQLIPQSSGTRYKIKTGTGNYLPSFAHNSGAKPASSTTASYAIAPIVDGKGTTYPDRFSLTSSSGVPLDCNGSALVGWNGSTQDPDGNNAWQFFPVRLSDATDMVLADQISIPHETIRMMVGDTRPFAAEIQPANATIQKYYTAIKNSNYAMISDGKVLGIAKGTSQITLSSVDGSKLSVSCTVYVGTTTQRKSTDTFRNNHTYSITNAGLTDGYLIATDTSTIYPQLRGVLRHEGSTLADKHYEDVALLGESHTQWQIVASSDGDFYLYNVGMQKFLVGNSKGKGYVFSNEPSPIIITPVSTEEISDESLAGCFYLSSGTGKDSRLSASTTTLNPAQQLGNGNPLLAVWKISAYNGLSTGLELLTQEALDNMLSATGIGTVKRTANETTVAYDLQGRRTSSTHPGIYIRNGHKIIR